MAALRRMKEFFWEVILPAAFAACLFWVVLTGGGCAAAPPTRTPPTALNHHGYSELVRDRADVDYVRRSFEPRACLRLDRDQYFRRTPSNKRR
jgi:hypothetical protein